MKISSVFSGMPLFFTIAVLVGMCVPLQSKANSALGAQLHDPILAALISFGSGLVILLLVSALLPAPRRGAAAILPAVRSRRVPWFFLLAGCIGAYLVMAQAMSVPIIGVALFTVGVVAGQTLSGLLVDHWGLGPAGRKAITLARALGAALMVAAVLVTMLGKVPAGGSALLWILLPLSAGFLMGFQQAANARSARAYGSVIASTLVNFLAGTVMLGAIWVLTHLGQPLPVLAGSWWMYTGGALGCVFISVSAWLIKHLGVLGSAMGMIAGQLVGSLLLDLILPVAGVGVGAGTVMGILMAGAAMVVMNLRRRPGRLES